jgi:hypothetical protein
MTMMPSQMECFCITLCLPHCTDPKVGNHTSNSSNMLTGALELAADCSAAGSAMVNRLGMAQVQVKPNVCVVPGCPPLAVACCNSWLEEMWLIEWNI